MMLIAISGQSGAPSLQSGVQLLLKRDGMHVRYQDTLPYVDAEVGIHCVEAVAVYHGQVVRRQLFYTVLSRERGCQNGVYLMCPFNSRFIGRSIVATK